MGRYFHDAQALAPSEVRAAGTGELPTLVSIDDDACRLFDDIGLGLNLSPEHAAFAMAEQAYWASAAAAGRLFVALDAREPVGFAALGFVDKEGYLAQISVRRAHMRRGVGAALLERAIGWSAMHGALWLTTYDHVPWNEPYYERFGFEVVKESDCGEQMRGVLRSERRALPAPDHRTAMVFRHSICEGV